MAGVGLLSIGFAVMILKKIISSLFMNCTLFLFLQHGRGEPDLVIFHSKDQIIKSVVKLIDNVLFMSPIHVKVTKLRV